MNCTTPRQRRAQALDPHPCHCTAMFTITKRSARSSWRRQDWSAG